MISQYLFILLSLVILTIDINAFHTHRPAVIPVAQYRRALHAELKDDIAADKLVFDEKSNRFYESNLGGGSTTSDEFVLKDKVTGEPIYLTREEKERIFLDSVQSYYYKGSQQLSDTEFNALREDLAWEGSVLVTLNRNETLFINAIQAYNKDKPIISDQKFDELKQFLRDSNSLIAVSTEPKCFIDTGVCKVNWAPDKTRTASLYLPATFVATIIYLGVIYEILAAVGVNLNPVLALLVGSVPISIFSKAVTENILFKDPAIASGVCPNCGVENRVFFGDVLGVVGDKDQATVKCTNCKTGMTIKRSTLRVSTLFSKAGPKIVATDE